MGLRILLRDRNARIVEKWQDAFMHCSDVDVSCGDIFDKSADAIISPANSFGFMDGGIDYAYLRFLGTQLQDELQMCIRLKHDGELPVGTAAILKTGHPVIKYLVSCPTMRVPEDVSDTVNAYLAFRAGLIAIRNFNEANGDMIASVLCPGLGTLTGRISPDACAKQMKTAYDKVIHGRTMIPDALFMAKNEHLQMK